MLAGCAKENIVPAGSDLNMTVKATVGDLTKVSNSGADSGFETGDALALYAWTGSADEVATPLVIDGIVNTLDESGAWVPQTSMLWKNTDDDHYFIGVSPVKKIKSFTADEYLLDPADYAASDLLLSTELVGLKAESGPVEMVFTHAMAKLNVNLKFRSQWAETPEVTSVATTAKNNYTVNYLTKAVTATGDDAQVALSPLENAASGYALSYSGLQVPQDEVTVITVVIDGKEFIYTADEAIDLRSAKVTTLGLNVGREDLTLGSVSVEDWVAEGTDLGDLEMDEESSGKKLLSTPFTLEALTAGTIVVNTPQVGMSFVRNGGDKEFLDGSTEIIVAEGDKVAFYGYGTDITCYNGTMITGGTAQVKAYGNIMSLLDENSFATATELNTQNTFLALFYNNTTLIDAGDLLLPASKLSPYCYRYMFGDCVNLTAVPDLPAITLTEGCYQSMFLDCEALTTAPALPSTELAASCYSCMFYGCSNLTDAPALPATTMAYNCYQSMFLRCKALATAPALPSTELANGCYSNMFIECTALIAAPALPATTLAENCYLNMFDGCSNLAAAPELPAPSLVTNCYKEMFFGCSNLASVTCLATDITASGCTKDWLKNAGGSVAGTKTFTAASSSVVWPASASGIPEGWTRIDL